jgi:hypothetical protein
MERLRGQSYMTHYRDSEIDQAQNQRRYFRAPLEFNRLRASLFQKTTGISDSFLF